MIQVKKTQESKTDNRNRMDLQIGQHTYRLTEREAVYLIRQMAELYFGSTKELEQNLLQHPGYSGENLTKIVDKEDKE
jgi:hypothetical protein